MKLLLWTDKYISCILQSSELVIFKWLLQIAEAVQFAEKTEKPPVAAIFQDVYDVVPSNLREQEKLLRETISGHSKDYPSDVPV